MAHLTMKERKLVKQCACRHVADLLDDDWGGPFKHRQLPDEVFTDYDAGCSPDDMGDQDEREDAADKLFFEVVKNIARKLRQEAK